MHLFDDRLDVGCVIYEGVEDTTPPKNKYYIIVSRTADTLLLGTVYINTEINTNVFHNKKLQSLHVLIRAENNPFLDYDSFVDCSYIHEKRADRVLQLLESDNKKYGYYGNIFSADLSEIVGKIKTAHTISTYFKKKYGFL